MNNGDDTATGEHLSDLNITILEQVNRKDTLYRKEREKYFIRKFNTFYKGLNHQPYIRRGGGRSSIYFVFDSLINT